MKSLNELKEIKTNCEIKRNKFSEDHPEYKRLSQCITSLKKQIEDAYYEAYSEPVSGDDGYLGDGVYK